MKEESLRIQSPSQMMSKGCIPSPPKRKVFRFHYQSSIVQLDTDVSENNGFSPEIIHLSIVVFHDFHHPFWGTTTCSRANNQIQTQVGGNEHTSHMFEIHQSCLTS